jgi:ParB-like chromosome segregation protein Spo0J
MTSRVKLACEDRVQIISLDCILPTRVITDEMLRASKCRCIAASLAELGLIEPLVVYPQAGAKGQFIILDGRTRHAIMRKMQWESCNCLIATDDEAYTYNHKVNRLSAIQEHFMIMRAIENGVSESRIAKALNVDVARIRQKRNLLDGICPEAIELLKDRRATTGALRELRRALPMRQIEIAELMCAAHNFSENYAKCLVAATPDEQLVDGERPRELRGLTSDELSRMEHEMETLGREFKLIEQSYGKNNLNMVVATGYLKQLLDNARVVRFLSQRYPDLLREFQKIIESRTLTDGSSAA